MLNDTSTIVNRQWSKRPDDERFTSITALAAYATWRREHSKQIRVTNRQLTVLPSTTDDFDVAIAGPNGVPAQFTHWSFGQLSGLADVPAKYLRSGLPGALIADNLNWGLHHLRNVEDIGVLLRRDTHAGIPSGTATLAAATGPNYGRIWDKTVCEHILDEFGDGVTGAFKVPGEFGRDVAITKANTTIYGSDRDIWMFLADEKNRVTIPNRRNGSSGTLARGFYVTNSEVGAGVLGFGMFLFDYLCCNRIMWGIEGKHEIRIRHTAGAPLRWNEEVKPVLAQLSRTDVSAKPIEETLREAQATKIKGDVETFLASRFGKNCVPSIIAAHLTEEQRPIESIWDASVAATAYAKGLKHTDARVAVERVAGDLLAKINPQRQMAFAEIQL